MSKDIEVVNCVYVNNINELTDGIDLKRKKVYPFYTNGWAPSLNTLYLVTNRDGSLHTVKVVDTPRIAQDNYDDIRLLNPLVTPIDRDNSVYRVYSKATDYLNPELKIRNMVRNWSKDYLLDKIVELLVKERNRNEQ